MAKKNSRASKRRKKNGSLRGRLDTMIRLLEDLFILEAASSRVATGKIQEILGIRKAPISKIAKGLKQAREHGNEGI